MKNRQHLLAMATAITLLLPVLNLTAQNTPAPLKKGKLVKVTLQNTTTHPMNLKSGDEAITLQAGQSKQVKVPSGTKITTAAATETSQSGTLVTEVSDGMSGSTVNLR